MAPRTKRSTIWEHFKEESNLNRAKCNYCSLYLSTKSGSLGNLNRHMKNKHPTISLTLCRQPTTTATALELDEVMIQTHKDVPSMSTVPVRTQNSNTNTDQRVENIGATTGTTLITNYIRKTPSARKIEQIDRQVVAMIAQGHHALRMVEEPAFKKLLEMVANCPGYQLPSRKTLSTSLLPKTYMEIFEKVQHKMMEANAVCLTTDGWTSVTNQSFIAVTAHFINTKTELSSALLGCINYNERHTSSNLVDFLKQIIQDWRLNNKVICIVSDNAANIIAAVRMGEWRSISCFAHTLNLVVQHAITQINEIKKVKTIVEYFKKSTNAFLKLQEIERQMGLPFLKLKQECPTRWNSSFEMLDRILKVKDAVISTLALLRSDLSLQSREWEIIETVIPILKPFYEITIEISSEQNVTLSKVLIFVQLISKHMTRCTSISHQHREVTAFVNILNNEIHTRFYDLEKNQLYAESTILDPRFKGKGFRSHETFNRAGEYLKRRLCDVILPMSAQGPSISSTVAVTEPSRVPRQTDEKSIWDDFDRDMSSIMRPENPVAAAVREYDKYLNEEYLDRKGDPLQWWSSRRHIYPHLYQYMLKRLCIQATSVPCERVFSNAGQILNQRRTLLKPEKVTQLLFLNSNM